MENYKKLLTRLDETSSIGQAMAVLDWDQQCYMPHAGDNARARQQGMLGRICHERSVSDETRTLLEAAEKEAAGLDPQSDERLALKVVRRGFDQSVKLPTALVEALITETSKAHGVWVEARKTNNFNHFAPTLERLLDLTRQRAEALGYEEHIYDALLDQYEPGARSVEVEKVFTAVRKELVMLLKDIKAAKQVDDSPMRRDFDEEKQLAFGRKVVERLGFNFERGRIDRAVHPFCTNFTRDDVRLTTRTERDWFPCSLMGTIHEAGHGMYEQGLHEKDNQTPLSSAAGLGTHESQSRLWENIVGRSRAFWQVFYPELQSQFPGVLDDISVEQFYKAINTVSPSFIRVEADEVTYNLHVFLRFEIEKEMLSGKLAVKDIPEAWNTKMQDYLGITPDSDANGCLQDVHWSAALFGYFPTYSLGTILSAQLYKKALVDNTQITPDLEKGEYSSLLTWLQNNVHHAGCRYFPHELTERATGESLNPTYYIEYLNTKFRDIYAC
jgi:carboxypeptidase Taq